MIFNLVRESNASDCSDTKEPKSRFVLKKQSDDGSGISGRLEISASDGRKFGIAPIDNYFVQKICNYFKFRYGNKWLPSNKNKKGTIVDWNESDDTCKEGIQNIVSNKNNDVILKKLDSCQPKQNQEHTWITCNDGLISTQHLSLFGRKKRNTVEEESEEELEEELEEDLEIHLESVIYSDEVRRVCPVGYSIKPNEIGEIDDAESNLCLPNTCYCPDKNRNPPESDYKLLENYCGINVEDEMNFLNDDDSVRWPWLVHLFPPWRIDNPLCDGTILNPRFVLTAAHCFISDGNAIRERRLTDAFYQKLSILHASMSETIVSKRLITHPEYDIRNIETHDIGLVVLKNIFEFDQFIRPICISSIGIQDVSEKIYGNFLTGQKKNEFADGISKVNAEIKCEDDFCTYDLVDMETLPCYGPRSGSPLIVANTDYRHDRLVKRWSIIGVGSSNSCIDDASSKPVFSSVRSIDGWIQSEIDNEMVKQEVCTNNRMVLCSSAYIEPRQIDTVEIANGVVFHLAIGISRGS